jgi:predicted transcriptional regulator
VSFPRRSPPIIALAILNSIGEKEEATKWDLIKVLGNESQFRIWIEEFLLSRNFIQERKDGRNSYYRKTELGEDFHKLLKNGNIVRGFLAISRGRLRTDSL